jgi:hypothetical protein
MIGADGPLRRPQKLSFCSKKCPTVPGPTPLGAQMASSRLPFHSREKYCHNGGMALASNYGGGYQVTDAWRDRGSANTIAALSRKCLVAHTVANSARRLGETVSALRS